MKACDKFERTELLMPVKETSVQTTENTTAQPTNIMVTPQAQTIAVHATTPSTAATKTNQATTQAKTPDLKQLTTLIKQACQAHADDEGWVKLGIVGTYLSRIMPEFDVRLYRFDKLSNLIKSMPKEFEIKSDGKVLSIKPKSSHRWSKEQLSEEKELLDLIAEHIQINADSQGWADFNRVIQGVGTKKLAQYGYAKASVLFENIATVQLQRKNKILSLKSIVSKRK